MNSSSPRSSQCPRRTAALIAMTASLFLAPASIDASEARALSQVHAFEEGCPPAKNGRVACGVVISPQSPAGINGSFVPTAYPGSGVGGGYAPADLQAAYNIPSTGGAGRTVAVIVAFDYPAAESDLSVYRSQYGLSACTTSNGCFRRVNQNGQAGYPGLPPEGKLWNVEAALDMDMVSASCPKCNILLIEANSELYADMAKAANTASLLGATTTNHSYSAPETSGLTAFNAYYNHPGQPTFAASGDHGYRNYLLKGAPLVPSYPASANSVAAVGGTELRPSPQTERKWIEFVWEQSYCEVEGVVQNCGATGGGCSGFHLKPSWQSDPGCSMRMTNDVAAVSDWDSTPVSIYNTTETEGWVHVGGTSAASPIFAGIVAQASPYSRSMGSELLYRANSSYDVVAGSNYEGGTCTPSYLCSAGIGYDGPTGLGTPNGVPSVSPSPGGSWGVMPTPNAPWPSGNAREGISCVSATDCMAVGKVLWGSSDWHASAMRWDGATWGTSPVVGEPGVGEAVLRAVSCPVAAFCMAVGDFENKIGAPAVTLAERWNGSKWSYQSTPSLNSGPSRLEGVSCTSSTACTAVGWYRTLTGSLELTAATWNGSSWAGVNPKTGNGEFSDISCYSSTACIAVGNQREPGGKVVGMAQSRNGSIWSRLTVPSPSGATAAKLTAVSCASSTACTAAGSYTDSGGSTWGLIERWNGSAWSIQAAPSPPGALSTQLKGVSCSTATACIAVGQSAGGAGSGALALRWDGSSWTLQSVVANPGIGNGDLVAASCVAAAKCATVGSYTDAVSSQVSFAQHLFSP